MIKDILLASQNYRQFLQRSFEFLKEQNKNFNYAEFSRRAGFSARSFPRDVILGKKRITASSWLRFADALKLQGDSRLYFSLLVALEEPNILPDKFDKQQIQRRLERVRNRMLAKSQAKNDEDFYRFSDWLPIYAALGTLDGGATLDEVSQRTKISEKNCEQVLSQMLEKGVIKKDHQKYFALNLHLIFSHIGKNDFFRRSFIKSSEDMKRKAESSFESDEHLFVHSVFSVKREKLPQLKEELRHLLLQYVDSAEDAQGNAIAQMTVALAPN